MTTSVSLNPTASASLQVNSQQVAAIKDLKTILDWNYEVTIHGLSTGSTKDMCYYATNNGNNAMSLAGHEIPGNKVTFTVEGGRFNLLNGISLAIQHVQTGKVSIATFSPTKTLNGDGVDITLPLPEQGEYKILVGADAKKAATQATQIGLLVA